MVSHSQADGKHCVHDVLIHILLDVYGCALSRLHLIGQRSFSPRTAYPCKFFLFGVGQSTT